MKINPNEVDCDKLVQRVSTLKNNDKIGMQKSVQDTARTSKTSGRTLSNQMTLSEFKVMAKKIPMLQDKDEVLVKEVFENLDLDRGGTLSIPEFRSI